MGFVWITLPSTIASKLDHFAANVEGGIHKLADSHASRAESAMKAGAPWNDHTEHARQGLTGTAEGADIYLFGTMFYNPYLETGTHNEDGSERMAPRPIIVPTMNETAPAYFSDAGELVMAMLGAG